MGRRHVTQGGCAPSLPPLDPTDRGRCVGRPRRRLRCSERGQRRDKQLGGRGVGVALDEHAALGRPDHPVPGGEQLNPQGQPTRRSTDRRPSARHTAERWLTVEPTESYQPLTRDGGKRRPRCCRGVFPNKRRWGLNSWPTSDLDCWSQSPIAAKLRFPYSTTDGGHRLGRHATYSEGSIWYPGLKRDW